MSRWTEDRRIHVDSPFPYPAWPLVCRFLLHQHQDPWCPPACRQRQWSDGRPVPLLNRPKMRYKSELISRSRVCTWSLNFLIRTRTCGAREHTSSSDLAHGFVMDWWWYRLEVNNIYIYVCVCVYIYVYKPQDSDDGWDFGSLKMYKKKVKHMQHAPRYSTLKLTCVAIEAGHGYHCSVCTQNSLFNMSKMSDWYIYILSGWRGRRDGQQTFLIHSLVSEARPVANPRMKENHERYCNCLTSPILLFFPFAL